MTDLNLPALREAVAKMTEGPWAAKPDGRHFVQADEHGEPLKRTGMRPAGDPFPLVGTVFGYREADLKGIVALRNAADALLDELEQLRSVEADFLQLSDVVGWHHGEAQIALARAEKAEAELAAARAALETAHELAGSAGMYCMGVDRTLWQAWVARKT